jgi:DinB superfamily
MSADPFLARPESSEYAPFYAGYVARVPAGNVLELMAEGGRITRDLVAGLEDAAALYRYAPGKWSIKEVLGHMADAERIFAYRALRFGRGDETPLAGFEENDYVPAGRFDARSVADLVAELEVVRNGTLSLFRHFDGADLARFGTANEHPISVRALGVILVGHEIHHRAILGERYGLVGTGS